VENGAQGQHVPVWEGPIDTNEGGVEGEEDDPETRARETNLAARILLDERERKTNELLGVLEPVTPGTYPSIILLLFIV
jgi:hypothetical protein